MVALEDQDPAGIASTPVGRDFLAAPADQSHLVHFYERDEQVVEVVADFFAAGLKAAQPCVIIATEDHRRELRRELSARGFQVEELSRSGLLVEHDARAMLARLMKDGMPDWNRVEQILGNELERCAGWRGHGPVRAFGEMVDLLWRDGKSEAALKLEEMWNDLSRIHSFSLLCAYVMANFYKEGDRDAFHRISCVHTHHLRTEVSDIEQSRRLLAEIEQRKAVEQQLREALQRAEAADRKKDEFLAMLGHELRNPIAPILTAAQLMRLRGSGSDRELSVIERQVRYLMRLVDDLLDISRLTRGTLALKKHRFEVAEVVANALEMVSPLLEQRGHQVDVDIPRAGLLVEADPVRLAQVVGNLLTNAAKYTPPGGRIEIEGRAEGARISIAVRDNGVGIAPEMLRQIFEPFVQAGRTLEGSRGGLGIGLTVARSLVELHCGEITAWSGGLGLGSEFVVRLPAFEPARGRATAPSAPASKVTSQSSLRILLVDDNADAAEMLSEALEDSGHRVVVAQDAPQALASAPSFAPEVALLDIGLPVMDGYELARRLREQFPDRPPRMIALTGYGQEHDKERSRRAGFDLHLTKPIDFDVLLALLQSKGPPL